MPRQDVDLATKHVELNDALTNATIDVTELTATRIAVTYRELSDGVEECSVDYDFTLVEAACPRDCVSKGATLNVSPSGAMSWQCECD